MDTPGTRRRLQPVQGAACRVSRLNHDELTPETSFSLLDLHVSQQHPEKELRSKRNRKMVLVKKMLSLNH